MNYKIGKQKLVRMIQESVARALGTQQPLIEMATCGVENWGKYTYKIAVHGASTNDRPTPHIHIYLNTDQNPYNRFNFEISFIDLICNDRITPIYQLDKQNHLKHTNRRECSWVGYNEIADGLKEFLARPCPQSKFGTFSTNLERVIYEWNRETDFVKTNNGGNPLKEYLDSHGLTPHPKYKDLFEPSNK